MRRVDPERDLVLSLLLATTVLAAASCSRSSSGARRTRTAEASGGVAVSTPTDPVPTDSRWMQTAGPPGGADIRVEMAPDRYVLYAGARGGGIYRSTDAGATWTLPAVFMERYATVAEIVLDPVDSRIIYVLGVESEPGFLKPAIGGRIFKSTDGASTWTEFAHPDGVMSLANSSVVGGSLIAADDQQRLFITESGGASAWLDRSIALPPGLEINDVAAGAAGEFWAASSGPRGQLYHTTNSGRRWYPVQLPAQRPPLSQLKDIAVDPAEFQRVYVTLTGPDAAPSTANLFRTDDGGKHWHNASTPSFGDRNQRVLTIDPVEDCIYVTAANQVYRSYDHGGAWESFKTPPPNSQQELTDIVDLAVDPRDGDVIYLPTGGLGMAKTIDDGQNWFSIKKGTQACAVGLIATVPGAEGTFYCNGDRAVFKTTDRGDTWTQMDHGAGAIQIDEIAVSPQNPNRVWIATDVGDLFESLDAGATWTLRYSAIRNTKGFRYGSVYALAAGPSLIPGNPDILYATKHGFGIWRSEDGGNKWTFSVNSRVDYTYTLALDPKNSNVLYSGYNPKPFEDFAMVRKTIDGGTTWTTSLSVSGATGVTSVVVDPHDSNTVCAGSTGELGGTIWISSDAGGHWTPVPNFNFANIHAMAPHPGDPGGAFAALWGNGTYYTVDHGASWEALFDAPTASVSAVMPTAASPTVFYVADRTAPRVYRATGAGPQPTWELYFDAGSSYYRVLTAAIAPSNASVMYASVFGNAGPMSGSVFRIANGLPIDVTGTLPTLPMALGVHPGDPDTVYALLHGAGSGVFKTRDGGTNWMLVSSPGSGLPQTPAVGYFGIVIDPVMPTRVYLFGGSDASLGSGGIVHSGANPAVMNTVYLSADAGATWLNLNDGNLGANSGAIKGLAIHPANPNVLFVGALNGVFRSLDGGGAWIDVSAGLDNNHLGGIGLSGDGTRIYAPTLGGGMFVGTIDQMTYDVTWSPGSTLNAPVNQVQLLAHPTVPGTYFASAYPGGVFRSTDGGMTWTEQNFGLPTVIVDDPVRQGYYAMAIARSNPDIMYLGIYERGVYKSTERGETWYPANGGSRLMAGKPIASLLVDPSDADRVYVATEEGVFLTTDGAATWSPYSTGLDLTDVRVLAMESGGKLLAGTRGNELYEYKTSAGQWEQMKQLDDYGQLWHLWDRGLYQYTSILFHPTDPEIAYIGTFPAGVFRTDDGGTVWREHNVGFTNDGIYFITFHPNNPDIIYAGTYNGINRTLDGGLHWHTWDDGWPDEQWVFSIEFDPRDPSVMYACSKNGENKGLGTPGFHGTVMKSVDSGRSWFRITSGLVDQEYFAVIVDPIRPDIVYLAGQEGFYITWNGGAQWQAWISGLTNAMPSHPNNVTRPLAISSDGQRLYLGSDGSGVYRRFLR